MNNPHGTRRESWSILLSTAFRRSQPWWALSQTCRLQNWGQCTCFVWNHPGYGTLWLKPWKTRKQQGILPTFSNAVWQLRRVKTNAIIYQMLGDRTVVNPTMIFHETLELHSKAHLPRSKCRLCCQRNHKDKWGSSSQLMWNRLNIALILPKFYTFIILCYIHEGNLKFHDKNRNTGCLFSCKILKFMHDNS